MAALSSRSRSRRGCSVQSSSAMRGDGDGVLEQAAEVGVVAGRRARRRAPGRGRAPGAHRRGPGSEQGARRICSRSARRRAALEQRLQRGVVDLAGEVLEEAFELVAVAVGGGQEAGGVGVLALGALDRAQLDLQLVAKALHAPAHAHELAALEAPGEHVGVAERAREGSRRCCRAARASGRECPTREIWRSLRVHAKTASTSSSQRSVATVWACSGWGPDAWRKPWPHDVRWFGCSR